MYRQSNFSKVRFQPLTQLVQLTVADMASIERRIKRFGHEISVQFGDGNIGCLDEGNDIAAHLEIKLLHRTC